MHHKTFVCTRNTWLVLFLSIIIFCTWSLFTAASTNCFRLGSVGAYCTSSRFPENNCLILLLFLLKNTAKTFGSLCLGSDFCFDFPNRWLVTSYRAFWFPAFPSNWPEALPLSDTSASTCARALVSHWVTGYRGSACLVRFLQIEVHSSHPSCGPQFHSYLEWPWSVWSLS